MTKKKHSKQNIYYLILAVLLLLAVGLFLNWSWNQCVEYRDNSASAISSKAMEDLSEKLGLELFCNNPPKSGENKSQVYTFCDKDGKPVAEFSAEFKKSGIFGLALFEAGEYKSLKSYGFIVADGCSASSEGRSTEGEVGEEYLFESLQKLYSNGSINNIPTSTKYTVDWAFDFNNIAFNSDNGECAILKIDDNTWYIYSEMDKSEADGLKSRVYKMADSYVRYMSNIADYYEIGQHIMSGSPVRSYLGSQLLDWYGNFASYRLKNVKMSNPVELGNNYVMINMSFSFSLVKYNGRTEDYPIELGFVVHKDANGVWKIADLRPNFLYDIDMFDY